MPLRVVTINKVGPLWHIHCNDASGSLERAQTQEQAITYVVGILAYRMDCTIQMMVYGERGELQETWAINKGKSRKLDLIVREKRGLKGRHEF